ncbi:MAG: MFS transporter [Candidatus Latescibacteria bacterium]|nr:MFS transporter [Candidatus Latescibacterota bacterium]
MNRWFHYSWVVLAMGTMVVFGSLGLARFGYTVVLPSMQASLGIENSQSGALATANLVGYLALSVIGGALASRFGPRAVITGGLALAGTSMVLTGTAEGFIAAMVWRAVAGVGSGMSNVPVMGLISSWFGIRRRGFAAGIAVAGSSVALIFLGPVVPKILAHYGDEGWRACWYIFGTVTLLIAAGAYFLLRNSPDELGIGALGVSEDDPPPQDKAAALEWGLVYQSGRVWLLGFVYVAFGFSYIIYMTFFFKYLVSEGGYTRETAGTLFMLVGWLSLFCGLVWGTISDYIGRKRALMLVYIIQAASFSLFALWSAPAGYTVSAVLFGLTAWSIPAIMAAACGDVLGPRLAPAALGFITLFFGIGQALGPSVAGIMADATGSFDSAFLLAGGVALLGAGGAFMIRDSNRRGVS